MTAYTSVSKGGNMNSRSLLVSTVLICLLVHSVFGLGSDDRFDPILGTVAHLKSGVLEPTRRAVEIPAHLRGTARDDYNYYIVMTGPANREIRDGLRMNGAEIVDYIPYNTFIIRLETDRVPEIKASCEWMDIWHPFFKIHPRLQDRMETVSVDIILHPGEETSEIVNYLNDEGLSTYPGLIGKDQWGIKTTVDPGLISVIAAFRGVQFMDEDLPEIPLNVNAQWVTQAWIQNERPLWDAGIDGTGQIVHVNDSGCRTTHRAFRDGNIPITDYGVFPNHRKIVAYFDAAAFSGNFGDECNHGSHVSGSVAGDDSSWTNNDGMAVNAKLVIGDIGMAGGSINADWPYTMFSEATDYGATIHNCSWGVDTEGEYSQDDSSVDSYMFWNQFQIAMIAVGNNPPNYYAGSPGCSKSAVVVGASKNGNFGNQGDEFATWSARGPTEDGRMVPMVLTPGESILSCTCLNDNGYLYSDGTSMASPVCAGNAALVRQYYTEGWYPDGAPSRGDTLTPLGSLIKATLIASTRDPDGTWEPPNDRTGWGRVVTDDALHIAGETRKLWIHQNTDGLSESDVETFEITAECGSELKFVVAWSDRPGTLTGSGPKIRNDLDLEVEAPGGAAYLGNVFSGGESVTGGSADRLNTTEVVWFRTPVAGTYTITVTYYNSDMGDVQPYAIVVVGENVSESSGDDEPPTVPGDVQLTPDGELSWSASTDNVGVTGYRIYRQTLPYFTVDGMTPLGSTTTETTYSVMGSIGDPDMNYYFRVTAHDAAENESGASDTVGEHDYETEDGS